MKRVRETELPVTPYSSFVNIWGFILFLVDIYSPSPPLNVNTRIFFEKLISS